MAAPRKKQLEPKVQTLDDFDAPVIVPEVSREDEIADIISQNEEAAKSYIEEEVISEPVVEIVKDPEPVINLTSESELAKQRGWEPIENVSRNGFPVRVTHNPLEPGVVAFWRKSRAFANATHKWEKTGFWTDSTTGQKIAFEAKWWKDRNV